MANLRPSFAPVLSLVLLSACGSGSSSQKPEDTTVSANPPAAAAASSSLLLSDQNVASQVAEAHIDTAIGAVAEEMADQAGGAALTGSDHKNAMHRFRECKVDGDKAVVTISQSVERDLSFTGPRRSYSNTFADYREKVRTWSRDQGQVSCDTNGKAAKLTPETMAGVTLDVTLKDTRSREQSLTTKKQSAVKTANKFSVDGTRHVVWKSMTSDADTYTFSKQSTHAVTTTSIVQKKDGTETTLTSSVKNADGAPFVISVQRKKSNLEMVSRTIASGTLESTHKDGTRVETVFKDVVYRADADDHCVAASGEINGSIFAKDDTTAKLTFKITFGDDPQIAFSNGTTIDYEQGGCELDDQEQQSTEAQSKAAVVVPAAAAPAPAEA